jgi:hypothetical protein
VAPYATDTRMANERSVRTVFMDVIMKVAPKGIKTLKRKSLSRSPR